MITNDLKIIGGNGSSPTENVLLATYHKYSEIILVQIVSSGQMWGWLKSIGIKEGFIDETLNTSYVGFNTPGSHEFFARRRPGMELALFQRSTGRSSSTISSGSGTKSQSDPCGFSDTFTRLRQTDPQFEAAWLKVQHSVATGNGPTNWSRVRERVIKEVKECKRYIAKN